MDRSRRYIEMCEKAAEVQKLWQPAHGDFFMGERGRIEGWVAGTHGKRNVVQGVEVRFENGMPKITRYVWLPRLDQLMELAQDRGKRFENVTLEFFNWTKKPYGGMQRPPRNVFDSLEQVWLAFVMFKKFGKIWNGGKWIRS